MTTPRMTPERLAEIREAVRTGRRHISYVFVSRDLLAELDAVTRERDEAHAALRTAHMALRVSNPMSEEGYEGRCRDKARAAIEACGVYPGFSYDSTASNAEEKPE